MGIVAVATASTCHPQCKWLCDDPVCPVRCPKEMCEMDDCPACETVCRPAVCRTTRTAPEPNCAPLCEKTKCAWKCKTPTLCPKPKCQLTCEQPGCSEEKEFGPPGGNSPCCPCNAGNTAFAVQHAEIHARKNGISGPKASFLEVMHGFSHQAQQGKAPCCP